MRCLSLLLQDCASNGTEDGGDGEDCCPQFVLAETFIDVAGTGVVIGIPGGTALGLSFGAHCCRWGPSALLGPPVSLVIHPGL